MRIISSLRQRLLRRPTLDKATWDNLLRADPEKARILRRRWRSLDELQKALQEIAESRGLLDPMLQAQIIQNRLVQRIEYLVDSRVRDLHYEGLISPWMRHSERSSHWLCYLVSLENLRGRGWSLEKAIARADSVAAGGVDELSPVEKRAVELLQGARRKPNKNLIEQRAIILAQTVENEWFALTSKRGRPKQKWVRKPDKDERPRLKVEEVVSIAVPVIEEFAATRIVFGRSSFKALHFIVEAYSDTTARSAIRWLQARQPLSQTVRQALSRYRRAAVSESAS